MQSSIYFGLVASFRRNFNLIMLVELILFELLLSLDVFVCAKASLAWYGNGNEQID